MEAQVNTRDIILIIHQIWCQICWKATCGAPDTDHSGLLLGIDCLGRQAIFRNKHQVELLQTGHLLIHSRIHPSGATQFLSQATNTERTCTTSLVMTQLLGNPIIFQGR